MNPAYPANEPAFQLKCAGVRALVRQNPLIPVALGAAEQAGILLGDGRDPSMKFSISA